MGYNIFRKMIRDLDHFYRVGNCTNSEPCLDPERIVNRSLYGTDYDPKDYGLIYRPNPLPQMYVTFA